jgi:hypothetical protein
MATVGQVQVSFDCAEPERVGGCVRLRRTGYEKLAVASGLGISGECAWALTSLLSHLTSA